MDKKRELNLVECYRRLYRIRRAEEKIRSEYSKDEMKTPTHLGIGAEAVTVGTLLAFPSKMKAFGTYRSHCLYLGMSNDLDGFFGEMYGRVTGCSKGKAGSMHMMLPEQGLMVTSAVVGTTIPVAVGYALANKYRNDPTPTMALFGDGATEEGAFYESLNFACLHKLNVLFVCEDNELAIHARPTTRRGFRSYRELVAAFDCSFEEADGTDVLDVFAAASRLADKMHAKSGPAFLHAPYFRFLEHVGIAEDFSAGYRERPANLEQKDPLKKFENHLRSLNIQFSDIQKEIDVEIESAVTKAVKAPRPPVAELYTDVYSGGDK